MVNTRRSINNHRGRATDLRWAKQPYIKRHSYKKRTVGQSGRGWCVCVCGGGGERGSRVLQRWNRVIFVPVLSNSLLILLVPRKDKEYVLDSGLPTAELWVAERNVSFVELVSEIQSTSEARRNQIRGLCVTNYKQTHAFITHTYEQGNDSMPTISRIMPTATTAAWTFWTIHYHRGSGSDPSTGWCFEQVVVQEIELSSPYFINWSSKTL